ncbi:MAG: hypothetical protein KIT19_03045 [Phycisphaeraceae bacterium]|nr:hypothetical protein [Phycisphaeraceae bacterium]
MNDLSQHDDRLVRYLDGAMSSGERTEFEKELSSNTSMRDAIGLDARVVESLRRALAPIEVSPANSRNTHVTDPDRVQPNRRLVRYLKTRIAVVAMAAAALICIPAISRLPWPKPNDRMSVPSVGMADLAALYSRVDERTIDMDWTFADDAELLEFMRQRFDRGLLFMPESDVAAVGWIDASGVISNSTAAMVVRKHEQLVVLLVDRARHSRLVAEAGEAFHELSVFQRRVGPFILHEITPLERPHLLELAYTVGSEIRLRSGEQGPGPRTQQ